MFSHCHNAEVKEVDGKKICTVCENECEVGSGEPETKKEEETKTPQPGDTCILEDGSEGIIAPDGACVPVATDEQKPKVGDACQLPDGSEGVFAEDAGNMICVPKEEEATTEDGSEQGQDGPGEGAE